MEKILFVCTGNTCRSPMAQGIFNMLSKREGCEGRYESLSAGLAACEGQPASKGAVQAMRELGWPIDTHRSQSVTAELLDQVSLCCAMTGRHAAALRTVCPELRVRVFDVPDPFGGDLDEYRQCRDVLYGQVEQLMRDLNRGERHGTV